MAKMKQRTDQLSPWYGSKPYFTHKKTCDNDPVLVLADSAGNIWKTLKGAGVQKQTHLNPPPVWPSGEVYAVSVLTGRRDWLVLSSSFQP